MKKTFITNNSKQTQRLGELMASELWGGEIVCLIGELGSGKTTFSQGVLKGLGVKGPYTSPTFLVMKHYKKEIQNPKLQILNKSKISKSLPRRQAGKIRNVFHVDVYRVGPKDILDLGWEEIVGGKNNIVIIEWAERIKAIVPKRAVWMEFEHLGKDKRKIILNPKSKITNSKYLPDMNVIQAGITML